MENKTRGNDRGFVNFMNTVMANKNFNKTSMPKQLRTLKRAKRILNQRPIKIKESSVIIKNQFDLKMIYLLNGIKRFEGTLSEDILEYYFNDLEKIKTAMNFLKDKVKNAQA